MDDARPGTEPLMLCWHAAMIGLFAPLTLPTAPAFAGDREYPLPGGVVIRPYGQFDLAYQDFNDGVDRTDTFVDNSNSNTRIGFYIYNPGLEQDLQFHFETGLGVRPSQETSQIFEPQFWDWQRTDIRKLQLIHSGTIGTLKVGQGSMPMDGITEIDLAGTVIAAKATIPEGAGSYILRTGNGAFSDIVIGDSFNNFDGGRKFRVRYDTPSFHGFSIGAAYGVEVLKADVDDNYFDITLRYGQEFGRYEIKGGVGMGYVDGEDDNAQTYAGSISIMDQRTGLNLSLAAGGDSAGARYLYLKPGWNARFLEIGTTKFIGEAFLGTDYVTDGSGSDMWGAAIIQDIDAWNTEIYLGYRHFSYNDLTPDAYRDAGLFKVGGRLRY